MAALLDRIVVGLLVLLGGDGAVSDPLLVAILLVGVAVDLAVRHRAKRGTERAVLRATELPADRASFGDSALVEALKAAGTSARRVLESWDQRPKP